MTPTSLGGLEVITEEPVRSPLWRPDRPVMFKNTSQILLSDGTTVYMCKRCETFYDDKIGRVRSHQQWAHPDKTKKTQKRQPAQLPAPEPSTNGEITPDVMALIQAALDPENGVMALRKKVAELEGSREAAMALLVAEQARVNDLERELAAARADVRTIADRSRGERSDAVRWRSQYEQLRAEITDILNHG